MNDRQPTTTGSIIAPPPIDTHGLPGDGSGDVRSEAEHESSVTVGAHDDEVIEGELVDDVTIDVEPADDHLIEIEPVGERGIDPDPADEQVVDAEPVDAEPADEQDEQVPDAEPVDEQVIDVELVEDPPVEPQPDGAQVFGSTEVGASDEPESGYESRPILNEDTQPVAHARAATIDIEAERIQSLSLAKALNAGLRKALFDDPRVLLMGEDIGPLGGVFRVTEGLQAEFGANRVIDTPLAEAGIIGTAIGLAMRGYRPVCEIQFEGFIFPGFDQITTQLAKMTNRHEGALSMPVVVRVPYGGHIGAIEHHQESPEAYFAHTPGLRVVSPSNPNDAYWMIQEAIASNDPVIFFEPKSRYWPKGDVDLLESAVPLHSSRTIRIGDDVTVVGYGAMLSQLLRVAELAADEGTSVEVIDLRSISPIDYEPILKSVRKTGRLVVAQEAPGFAGIGSEIAATVTEKAFYSLQAPVIRVAAFDVPFPPSKVEELYLPDADRVLEAIDRSLAY